eukprot:768732-Hanusia_phi.AAC.11
MKSQPWHWRTCLTSGTGIGFRFIIRAYLDLHIAVSKMKALSHNTVCVRRNFLICCISTPLGKSVPFLRTVSFLRSYMGSVKESIQTERNANHKSRRKYSMTVLCLSEDRWGTQPKTPSELSPFVDQQGFHRICATFKIFFVFVVN